MDAVDVEIVRCTLAASLEEAETNICQTSFSPIVYEVRDFCTAVLRPDGRFIAQGMGGIPIFLGDLDAPVRDLMTRHGATMRPGDVYVTNEAAVCGQHLNNVVALRPIFVDDEPVAVAAVRVHWVDIGGRAAGGWVSDTTDVRQEGLQLPCLLAERDGQVQNGLTDLVAANVRYADAVLGDLRAQLAVTSLLEERVRGLVAVYGVDGFRAAVERIWADTDRLVGAALAEWRTGRGEAEARLDTALGDDEPPTIHAAASLDDSGVVTVDFTGTSGQLAVPINSGFGSLIAARIAFKLLTAADRPPDDGGFRRLQVVIPDGTLLSAVTPAPLAQWSAPLPTAVDVVLRAMAPLVPDLVGGGHHGELGGFALFGVDPVTGEDFYQIDTITGGWGGTPRAPGRSALKSVCHGDTYTTSVELEERTIPLLVRAYRLREGSGGAGVHPGGLGTERIYDIRTPTRLNLGLVRGDLAPWGLDGGEPAAPSEVIVERPNAAAVRLMRGTAIELPSGSVLAIRSGGGGGFGAPDAGAES